MVSKVEKWLSLEEEAYRLVEVGRNHGLELFVGDVARQAVGVAQVGSDAGQRHGVAQRRQRRRLHRRRRARRRRRRHRSRRRRPGEELLPRQRLPAIIDAIVQCPT